jgi:hypothetical protein
MQMKALRCPKPNPCRGVRNDRLSRKRWSSRETRRLAELQRLYEGLRLEIIYHSDQKAAEVAIRLGRDSERVRGGRSVCPTATTAGPTGQETALWRHRLQPGRGVRAGGRSGVTMFVTRMYCVSGSGTRWRPAGRPVRSARQMPGLVGGECSASSASRCRATSVAPSLGGSTPSANRWLALPRPARPCPRGPGSHGRGPHRAPCRSRQSARGRCR